ncbi:MAG TPA: WD40 repeat domain-containing protein [Isosphaeraceae bacterium]|nr:WD40 repeat domain-containing protein [Isosphaeraceae bacterium]
MRHQTSGTIVLLDSRTGQERLRIAVPDSEVWALAFSPDGTTLAATVGWERGQIRLYEVATGREVRTITTPPTRTPALAFTPDGSRLVAGMADTSVLIRKAGPGP